MASSTTGCPHPGLQIGNRGKLARIVLKLEGVTPAPGIRDKGEKVKIALQIGSRVIVPNQGPLRLRTFRGRKKSSLSLYMESSSRYLESSVLWAKYLTIDTM